MKLNRAWIPNSLTMGNLLFGFLSIIYASNGHYVAAGFCILFAALLDGFDGQVARMLHVSSEIGAQLDSLADCVAFGVAPGYLAYSAYFSDITIALQGVDKVIPCGMFLAAIFPLCAAYRLARFNVDHDPSSFSGLPSPIAGIVMALIPIAFRDNSVIKNDTFVFYLFIVFFILSALLMVSTVRFAKPQTWVFNRLHGAKLIILILLIVSLAVIFHKFLLIIFIGLIAFYIVACIYSAIIQFIQDRRY